MSLWNKFVVLEGLDGSGTTTQMNRLEEYCRRNNIPCWKTFEPSNGFIGRAAREVLEGREKVHPLTLAQLFAADRREHVKAMEDHLKRGEWVLCDRYYYSSLAYQSLELPFETVRDLNREFPLPGHCFYLQCSVETSARRRGGRDSEDIYETDALQKRVADNYEKAFSHIPAKAGILHRIDGELTPEEITAAILEISGLSAGPS